MSPKTTDFDILELAPLIRDRAVSSAAATAAQLERIAALDGRLHSYARLMADAAMVQSESADAEIAAGRYRGPLHGVPVAVKDLFWTQGVPTAAGMSIHRDFRPPQDATVVARLTRAGAVLLGKLQMTEGAYSDHHPTVTPPVNPWDPRAWTGISSSGPGVAVAAGLCHGALASDTGGSIRWPSAANGVTGLKPSWGRVSRHGTFELAASLDHVGPIARSAADCAVLLQAIAGPDPKDPTARPDPTQDYLAEGRRGVRGLRVGIDAAWNGEGVDAVVVAALSEAVAVFRGLGCEIVEARAPDVAAAVADWPDNCAVEAAVAHTETYPARREDYGEVLAAVIEAGRALGGLAYQRILLRRAELKGRFATLLASVDVLLTPAHPFAPLTLGTIRTLGDQPGLIAGLQRYTCPFNMTGHPTLSLPAGFSADGLPIGLQLAARDLGEDRLLRMGMAYQSATTWHRRRPALEGAQG